MAMLTNGEHDNLWRGAFKSIPNIERDLAIIANHIAYRTKFDVLKELHDGKIIEDKEYYETIIALGSAITLLDEDEVSKCKEEVNMLYS